MEAPRSAPRERERERARTTSGSDQVHSWILVTSHVLSAAWRIARASVMTALSLLSATLSYFRSLYLYLGHQLKWWVGYLQRKFKRNLSVEAEVDLLSYCAREWKGETPRARLMRKLPEKLLFSQGCNWIQQYSFGPEKYTGSNVFGKLRKCVELLKLQWTEFSGMRDYHKRGSMCNGLFSDAILECKLYEALKFLMLYQVTEAYEQMKTNKIIPNLFRLLFARESSSDPLSFMMNHLNSIGDTCGLDQIDLFILGYSLQVKIKVFRLFKFNSRDFAVCYPEEPLREWPEISLLTENGHQYHIPVF
ncbi:inactive ubiquitin thioesterase OTULINL isoform X4 [Mus pahari]|uniref:inactive ubiquitin thioesterase OTULINL isoform X4 n=1 Tax=Mus pahari TaxID=10093 RepID=UPI000A30D3CB|nr:inactive ubiquitin thioesterase OTULINL isoform X4 [Mus pahari]